VLVALLTRDRWSARAEHFLRAQSVHAVVSDFAALEFASAVARRVRTGETTVAAASSGLARLDRWAVRNSESIAISPADVSLAATYVRRLDLTLRAPDAINIAIAVRAGAALATFDTRMESVARTLGCDIAASDPETT
jgi:uncharacterized protein